MSLAFTLFFIFKIAAAKFVNKCIGIVIKMIIRAVGKEGGETGMEKRNAPIMKSI